MNFCYGFTVRIKASTPYYTVRAAQPQILQTVLVHNTGISRSLRLMTCSCYIFDVIVLHTRRRGYCRKSRDKRLLSTNNFVFETTDFVAPWRVTLSDAPINLSWHTITVPLVVAGAVVLSVDWRVKNSVLPGTGSA